VPTKGALGKLCLCRVPQIRAIRQTQPLPSASDRRTRQTPIHNTYACRMPPTPQTPHANAPPHANACARHRTAARPPLACCRTPTPTLATALPIVLRLRPTACQHLCSPPRRRSSSAYPRPHAGPPPPWPARASTARHGRQVSFPLNTSDGG